MALYLDELFKEKEKVLKEASTIKSKYQYLLEEKKQQSDRIRYLEKKLAETNKKSTFVSRDDSRSLTESVRDCVTNIVNTHYTRYGEKRIGKEIADVLWSYNFMNGTVRDELFKRARNDLRKVFSPAESLKKMDLSSGSLNLMGVEIMRSVESGDKKYFVSVIPSSDEIKRVGKRLATYADDIET